MLKKLIALLTRTKKPTYKLQTFPVIKRHILEYTILFCMAIMLSNCVTAPVSPNEPTQQEQSIRLDSTILDWSVLDTGWNVFTIQNYSSLWSHAYRFIVLDHELVEYFQTTPSDLGISDDNLYNIGNKIYFHKGNLTNDIGESSADCIAPLAIVFYFEYQTTNQRTKL